MIEADTLEINKNEADAVQMIFDHYLGEASLGKVEDMLCTKQISSSYEDSKVDVGCRDSYFLQLNKYNITVGFEAFAVAQFEKSTVVIPISIFCNICYNGFKGK